MWVTPAQNCASKFHIILSLRQLDHPKAFQVQTTHTTTTLLIIMSDTCSEKNLRSNSRTGQGQGSTTTTNKVGGTCVTPKPTATGGKYKSKPAVNPAQDAALDDQLRTSLTNLLSSDATLLQLLIAAVADAFVIKLLSDDHIIATIN